MKRLSRRDLELIASGIVLTYRGLPYVKGSELFRIDPELVNKDLLGLTVGYEHLSLDGQTLGLTSFQEMGVEVYDGCNEPFTYVLDGKTILVEKDLRDDMSKAGRKNFSLMHEGAHQILKMLYPLDYGAEQTSAPPLHYYKVKDERFRHSLDWEEWQANTLAAAILMPEELLCRALYMFGLGERIDILNRLYRKREYDQFCNLAQFLGVSKQALAVRLKQLGRLRCAQLDNPHQILDIEGEVDPFEV